MVVGSLLAAVVDVRTRRIPNALTGTLAAIAIVASVPLGVIHLSIVLVVMLIVFAIGTFAFACGWFGGGDVKLLAACCGFVGFPGALPLVLYTFGFAGIVAGVEIFRQRYLRGRLSGQSSLVGVASPGQLPSLMASPSLRAHAYMSFQRFQSARFYGFRYERSAYAIDCRYSPGNWYGVFGLQFSPPFSQFFGHRHPAQCRYCS
jgi:prepilin peptidase CpaA